MISFPLKFRSTIGIFSHWNALLDALPHKLPWCVVHYWKRNFAYFKNIEAASYFLYIRKNNNAFRTKMRFGSEFFAYMYYSCIDIKKHTKLHSLFIFTCIKISRYITSVSNQPTISKIIVPAYVLYYLLGILKYLLYNICISSLLFEAITNFFLNFQDEMSVSILSGPFAFNIYIL